MQSRERVGPNAKQAQNTPQRECTIVMLLTVVVAVSSNKNIIAARCYYLYLSSSTTRGCRIPNDNQASRSFANGPLDLLRSCAS